MRQPVSTTRRSLANGWRSANRLDGAAFDFALGGVDLGVALDDALRQLRVAADDGGEAVIDGGFGQPAHARDFVGERVEFFGESFDGVIGHVALHSRASAGGRRLRCLWRRLTCVSRTGQ